MRHKPKPTPFAYALLIDRTYLTKKEAQSIAGKLKKLGPETCLTLIDIVEKEKP